MTAETSTTEFRPSIRRVVAMLLIALVSASSGVAMIVWGSGFEMVLGFVVVGVFGVIGIPLLAYQLIRRPVMVRLTDLGVQFHQRPHVPWHEIEDVEARSVLGSQLVVLWLVEGAVERLTAGDPAGAEALRKHSRRFGREALWTPAGVAGGHKLLVTEIKTRLVRAGGQVPSDAD